MEKANFAERKILARHSGEKSQHLASEENKLIGNFLASRLGRLLVAKRLAEENKLPIARKYRKNAADQTMMQQVHSRVSHHAKLQMAPVR
jgi:hypothetical protein